MRLTHLSALSPIVATLLEILKYVLPSVVVLITAYVIVQRFTVNELRRKQVALLRETADTTIRLRLQAYERLAVFMERISPRSIVPRVYLPGMTVQDLRTALQVTINTEFEHNLSQQLYVSRQVWETVKGVKEQELAMIHQIASQLSPDAAATELHRRVTDFILTSETQPPTEVALQIISDEARSVLSLGVAG